MARSPEVLILVGSTECGVGAVVTALTAEGSAYAVCRERSLAGDGRVANGRGSVRPPLAITRYQKADYLYVRRDDADGSARGLTADDLRPAGPRSIPLLPLPDLSSARLVSRALRARGYRSRVVYVYAPESYRAHVSRAARRVDAERRAKIEAINTLFRGADLFVVAQADGIASDFVRLIEALRAQPDTGRIGRPRGLDAAALDLVEHDLRFLQRWLRDSGRHPMLAYAAAGASNASPGSAA